MSGQHPFGVGQLPAAQRVVQAGPVARRPTRFITESGTTSARNASTVAVVNGWTARRNQKHIRPGCRSGWSTMWARRRSAWRCQPTVGTSHRRPRCQCSPRALTPQASIPGSRWVRRAWPDRRRQCDEREAVGSGGRDLDLLDPSSGRGDLGPDVHPFVHRRGADQLGGGPQRQGTCRCLDRGDGHRDPGAAEAAVRAGQVRCDDEGRRAGPSAGSSPRKARSASLRSRKEAGPSSVTSMTLPAPVTSTPNPQRRGPGAGEVRTEERQRRSHERVAAASSYRSGRTSLKKACCVPS